MFWLKCKNPHPAGVIYEEICTCTENYIGKRKQNVETRSEKHSDINKISEPHNHLKGNPTHAFTWNVPMTGSINDELMINLEASLIALSRPLLNKQINWNKLLLFRNSVT